MIGVCIKYFNENYGGMLQAYATIQMLESKGLEYELIQYEKKRNGMELLMSAPRLLNGTLLSEKYEEFQKWSRRKIDARFSNSDDIRRRAFQQFSEVHFTKRSPVYVGYPALCKGANRYTAILSGSDQLWSPAGLPTNYYNLMFVPDGIRKISYASSFGVNQIPWYQRKRTSRFLNRIEYVSMRENRGRDIVKELTGRDVPVVLDPVFFLDKDGWEEKIPPKKESNEQYLLAYFLGKQSEYREAVKEAAQNLHCKIITLRHIDQYVAKDEQFGEEAPYDVAPDRFLNLLRGASYVCTDSFHGTCFSIIHKKQFVVFDRYAKGAKYSRNSRIDTLCENLGLQDRRYKGRTKLTEQLKQEMDYRLTEQRIQEWKKRSEAFLEEAFRGISEV